MKIKRFGIPLFAGGKGTREQADNAAPLDFVRAQAADAQSMLPALRELGVPVLEQRFVHDGPV